MASYTIPIKDNIYCVEIKKIEHTFVANVSKNFEYNTSIGKVFEYDIVVGDLVNKTYSSLGENAINILSCNDVETITVQVFNCEAQEVQIISDAIAGYVQKSINFEENIELSEVCSILQLVYASPQLNTANVSVLDGISTCFVIQDYPSQSGSLIYTGSSQTPFWNNYDEDKMTLNVSSQTNAGIYTASFTPKDGYVWSDGTSSSKSVNWTISKDVGSISLSQTSLTLDSDNTSASFTVTRSGDGVISAVSSNTDIATVSVSGNTVTVSSVNSSSGTVNITVSVAEGTNHTAPTDAVCTVDCDFVASLNDTSWADISDISDAGLASNYFAVGDCKAVTLNGTVGSLTFDNETYYCYIIGIDHNIGIEGANKIHFQFGKTALSNGTNICFIDEAEGSLKDEGSWFNMNNYEAAVAMNQGGWEQSHMRTVICPEFKNALPPDLRTVLKTITKYSDNTGGGSDSANYVTATSDEIFLLAEYEVLGERNCANTTEQNYQEQYDYYSSGGFSIIKYDQISGFAEAGIRYPYPWWLRSVYASEDSRFCAVNNITSEPVSGRFGGVSTGFAPAFCV